MTNSPFLISDGLAFCFFNFDVLMLYHLLDFDAVTPSHLIRLPNEFTLYKFNLNFYDLKHPTYLTYIFKKLKHHTTFFSKS